MIRIINLRNYVLKENEILFRVDRGTPVGNPFHMNSESQRDEVCIKYEEYFNNRRAQGGTAFVEYLKQIIVVAKTNDVALGCWCYPKRCHAKTIKKFVEDVLTSVNINIKEGTFDTIAVDTFVEDTIKDVYSEINEILNKHSLGNLEVKRAYISALYDYFY